MENLNNNIETPDKLPTLTIGKYTVETPVIQWWMWVWYSWPELAWNVALNWWIGTLTAAALIKAPRNRHLLTNALKEAKTIKWEKLTDQEIEDIFHEQNLFCIKKEVKEAKKISQWKWAIFINIMHATSRYEEQVKAACEAGVDGIVSGAGLPTELPALTADYPDVANIPILSNKRWVEFLIKKWRSRYEVLPDSIVLEELSAWWHLWTKDVAWIEDDIDSKLDKSIPAVKKYFEDLYQYDQLLHSLSQDEDEDVHEDIVATFISEFVKKTWMVPDFPKFKANDNLLEIIKNKVQHHCDLLEISNHKKNKFAWLEWAYKDRKKYDIPVIAAGNMVNKEEIQRKLNLWADWVQLGTRFLATKESTASQSYKQAIVAAKSKEDIKTAISAVPLPSRFLKWSEWLFTTKTIKWDSKKCLFNCLKAGKCGPRDWIEWTASMSMHNNGWLWCITDQLAKSNEWGGEWGLGFIWESGLRIDSIETVENIFEELK